VSVTSSEIRKRARLIRKANPNGDTLENLFESQNKICALCDKPMQDIIVCELDHGTPVITFARNLSLPIDEAIRQCNDPKNLWCVHTSCNSAKYVLTRDQWFLRGLNNREAPRLLTEGELLTLQFRRGAGGRIGGRRLHEIHPEMAAQIGRKNAENGHLARIATPESCANGGRISGRIVGPKVCHVRWHVNRGISNPACALCQVA
jgi:hypothetical protein